MFNYLFALIPAWLITNLADTLLGQVASDVYLILVALARVGQLFVTRGRLHDSNHSGWWFWIQLILVIGTL
ncbi:DUF805 domain-containing protein [Fructilactobacillus ixorae]|uniref:DUF805 domain-containing protein n=1 Tax=Fructilactobacillus ixorae TaxID=1750535 RepID=UPI00338EC805